MISEGHKANFETIRTAAANNDLLLLEGYTRIGGKPVTLLCAGYKDDEGAFNIVPLAQLFEDNPYDLFVTDKETVAVAWGDKQHPNYFYDSIDIAPFVSDVDLARDILERYLEDDDRAEKHAAQFAEEVINKLPEKWSLSKIDLAVWIAHAEGTDPHEAAATAAAIAMTSAPKKEL